MQALCGKEIYNYGDVRSFVESNLDNFLIDQYLNDKYGDIDLPYHGDTAASEIIRALSSDEDMLNIRKMIIDEYVLSLTTQMEEYGIARFPYNWTLFSGEIYITLHK